MTVAVAGDGVGMLTVCPCVPFTTAGAEARVEGSATASTVGFVRVLAGRSCKSIFARTITVCVGSTVAVARNQIAVLALEASVMVGGGSALEAVGAVAVEDALACRAADTSVANAGAGLFVDRSAQSVAERVRITGFARFEAVVNIVLEGVV